MTERIQAACPFLGPHDFSWHDPLLWSFHLIRLLSSKYFKFPNYQIHEDSTAVHNKSINEFTLVKKKRLDDLEHRWATQKANGKHVYTPPALMSLHWGFCWQGKEPAQRKTNQSKMELWYLLCYSSWMNRSLQRTMDQTRLHLEMDNPAMLTHANTQLLPQHTHNTPQRSQAHLQTAQFSCSGVLCPMEQSQKAVSCHV